MPRLPYTPVSSPYGIDPEFDPQQPASAERDDYQMTTEPGSQSTCGPEGCAGSPEANVSTLADASVVQTVEHPSCGSGKSSGCHVPYVILTAGCVVMILLVMLSFVSISAALKKKR